MEPRDPALLLRAVYSQLAGAQSDQSTRQSTQQTLVDTNLIEFLRSESYMSYVSMAHCSISNEFKMNNGCHFTCSRSSQIGAYYGHTVIPTNKPPLGMLSCWLCMGLPRRKIATKIGLLLHLCRSFGSLSGHQLSTLPPEVRPETLVLPER